MALPAPNQGYQLKAETIQYQDATFKESLGTAISSAITQAQINLFTKSPILKMLGGGALAERADLKRREKFLATGRDPNTGRKLTREELEERRKRAKDLGALAEIREILQGTLLDWKGKYDAIPVTMVPSRLPLPAEKQKVVAPSEEGGYSLADEERAAEQEMEDDQDQLESEKRQQGFFSKLFGKKDEDGKGGSLLSSLMGMLTPLLGLFKGGISGMLGKIIGPLMSLLGSGAAFIISGIGTVLSSLAPFIGTVLLPLLLAGAAGLAIKSFIDKWAYEREKQGKIAADKGVARAYAVKGKDGTERFATAEELKISEEQIQQAKEKGTSITTATGEQVDPTEILLQTKTDEKTGKRVLTNTPIAGMMNVEQRRVYNRVMKLKGFRAEYGGLFDGENPSGRYPEWMVKDLEDLDAKMAVHESNVPGWRDTIDAGGLEQFKSSRDGILNNMKLFVNKIDSMKDDGMKSFAKAILEDVSNKYRSFAPLYSVKDGFDSALSKEYLREGEILGGKYNMIPKALMSEKEQTDWFNSGLIRPLDREPMGVGFSIGGRGTVSTGVQSEPPTIPAALTAPPSPAGAGMLKSASNLEAAKSQPPAMPSISSNVNTVQTNNSANVMSAPSAQRRTGADMSPMFNFPWQSAVYR